MDAELPSGYLFHNLDRTLERVKLAFDFAEAMDLSADDTKVLALAAWFQDLGYVERHEDHQKSSIRLLEAFFEKEKGDPRVLEEVKTVILGANEPDPEGLLARALHDVNASWLGEKRFFGLNNLLRLERENLEGLQISLVDWQTAMAERLVKTNYYTSFGRSHFLDRKIKNIARQRDRLAKAGQKEIRQKTGKDFGRGVDTVYRVTFRNHINLSRIADGKANMIISINTIVLSVLIALASATSIRENIVANWHFIIPVAVLMFSSLTALVFAVLSALPKVSSSRFSEEDLDTHQVSMLYFGNFLQLEKDKFVRYLRELKKDQEILYDDLARDLYMLGKVLEEKYRLLTYSYRIFMGGLVLSMLALVLIVVFSYFN